MSVYLLHADRPYIPAGCEGRPECWLCHYLGSAPDDTAPLWPNLAERIAAHRKGRGSNVCLVWKRAGITFTLARTWPGGRTEERRIKRSYHFRRLCPVCHPMPRIDRWAGGQLPRPCERIKTRLINPATIDDPWAALPVAS